MSHYDPPVLPRIEPEERMESGDRTVLIVVAVFVFGAFAAELASSFSWLKAGAIVLLVAYVGLIGLHEAGHAIVAGLLGWRVCRVVIGMGKPLVRFRVRGVPVTLCRYPVGGHVVPAPRTLSGARYKSSLIYFAGPGVELLLVLLLVAVFGYGPLTEPASDMLLLSAQATAAAALFGALMNLIPMRLEEGAMTDGLGVLTSPGIPDEVLDGWRARPYTIHAESYLLSKNRELALATLEAGVDELGESLSCRVRLAASLLEAHAPERVVELLDPLVQKDDVPKTLQASILVLLAEALVLCDASRLGDAADYTEYALQLAPHDADIGLVRARVLIEQGSYHEALRLLDGVRPQVGDELLADTRDTTLALLELRRGRRDQALDLVRQLDLRGARGFELDHVKRQLGVGPSLADAPQVDTGNS